MTFELSNEVLSYLAEHEQETLDLIKTLCGIPAPSWHEEKRAAFCKEWLESQGATGVYIDEALNVIYPVGCEGKEDIILFMAHTDTVFPDTEPMPFTSDGEYFYSPGVGDDTACLAVMLMIAKYITEKGLSSPYGILFVANSGEEGLGNLKGTRQVMKDFGYKIKEFYTFDSQYTAYVNRCVGSERYELTFKTEGGHSFNEFGNRNAIRAMSEFICKMYECSVPQIPDTKTTYNVGVVEGGTSVNTIAQSAKCLYEFRSDSAECLDTMRDYFEREVEKLRRDGLAEIEVKTVGIRPCGSGYDEDKLKMMGDKVKAISEKHSGLPCRADSGSTDCNIPMSMGIPAICVGSYIGAKWHTREEKILISSISVGLKIAAELILGYFE
jgi:acetylornithine deacetylase/succinyl-diaminopimelate desuccinylase-like protein